MAWRRPLPIALTLGALAAGSLGGCSLLVDLDGYASEGDASLDGSDATAPAEGAVGDAPAQANDGATADAADCGAGCAIGGTCYAAGAANPVNSCQSCQSATPNAWSSVADGTACGSSGVCVGGKCGTCTTTAYVPPQAAQAYPLGSSDLWFCPKTASTQCTASQLLAAVKTTDGNEARSDLNQSAGSPSIDATSFFGASAIPAGSFIQGVQVRIYKFGSGTQLVFDSVVELLKGGNKLGTENKAVTNASWPPSVDVTSYGCATCTWGVAGGLTYSDVTDPSFGVRLIAQNHNTAYQPSAYVDSIAMAVTYCH